MAMMRQGASPQRALDVLTTIELYEIVGRRPSAVYLDAALKPQAAADGPHRLNELVYRPGRAVPGEQIHLMSGRTYVLDAENRYRGALLIEPNAISVETALSQAHRDRAAEESKIDSLVLAGELADGKPRRAQTPALPRYDRMYAADRPLIADQPRPPRGGAATTDRTPDVA